MINDTKAEIRGLLIASTSYTNSNIIWGNYEQSLDYDTFAVIQSPLEDSYNQMNSESREIMIQIQHFVKKKNDGQNYSSIADALNYYAEKVLKDYQSSTLLYVRTALKRNAILIDEFYQTNLQIIFLQQ